MAAYPLSHMCLCAFDTNFFISRLSQFSLRVRSTTTPLWDAVADRMEFAIHNVVCNSAARCCITLGTSYVAKYSLLQRTALSFCYRPSPSIPGSGGFLNMAKKWEAIPRWHFRSQRCCTFNILCVLQVSLPVLLWFGVDPCGPIYNAAVIESSFLPHHCGIIVALGMPCTHCARSANFWMSANTRTLATFWW